MDKAAFLQACQAVMNGPRETGGIGTFGEKTLHAVLKHYFDPDPAHHEINIGPYVSDIWNDAGFVEIQTAGFYRLREKLDLLLTQAPVTVVYPVPALKWVIWLDEDGVAGDRRKSPKQAGPWEILPELYGVKSLLGREDLSFCAVLLELEEYRLKNGWGNGGKRGSTRFERMPVGLLDEVWLRSPGDYRALVPDALPEQFTAKEFSKAAKLSGRKAWQGLNVLLEMGVLERTEKVKNAYLYRRKK